MYNDTGMRPMQLSQSKNMPKYMDDFIRYACVYLGLDKLRGEIHISYRTRLEGECYGMCWGDRQECEIQIASQTFGETISREDKLKTIAHELVHAYQYLTGKLKCDPENLDIDKEWSSLWEGKQYRYMPDDEKSKPWEIEAVHFENEVYYCYLEDNSLYK